LPRPMLDRLNLEDRVFHPLSTPFGVMERALQELQFILRRSRVLLCARKHRVFYFRSPQRRQSCLAKWCPELRATLVVLARLVANTACRRNASQRPVDRLSKRDRWRFVESAKRTTSP